MLGLIDMTAITTIWGHSSAGRAPAWHAGGQRFESAWLHQINLKLSNMSMCAAITSVCLYEIAVRDFSIIIIHLVVEK